MRINEISRDGNSGCGGEVESLTDAAEIDNAMMADTRKGIRSA